MIFTVVLQKCFTTVFLFYVKVGTVVVVYKLHNKRENKMRHTKNNKTYIVTVNGMVVPNIRIAAEMVGISSKALYIRVFRQYGRDLIATINGHNVIIQQFFSNN